MDIEAELRKKENKSLELKALLGKRLADSSAEDLQELSNELENTLLLIKSLKSTEPFKYLPKPFNPTEYKISFPFFEPNGEAFLSLLDRDKIVRRINRIAMPGPADTQFRTPKYQPIIISTSRGMGKTFLMKMIALQKVPPGLECPLIIDALKYGRIISFDFTKLSGDRDVQAMQRFFPKIMIYFLLRMFQGCEVDGIFFEECEFNSVATFRGKQSRFNDWKDRCLHIGTDGMIGEYIRLTNIAFGVECSSPPVFLLDEIQELCVDTNEPSKSSTQFHTLLSFLLAQLAGLYKPICLCTGTNDGKLLLITEKSSIIPDLEHRYVVIEPVLSLTPLKTGFLRNWEEMTNQRNKGRSGEYDAIRFNPEDELIEALIHSSYKIPRLLSLAHHVWYTGMIEEADNKHVHLLMEFEKTARRYYSEMVDIWFEFNTNEIAHIIFATGCKWPVDDPESHIPGTNRTWNSLIEKSLIFPYEEDYYLFPYNLVWSNTHYSVRKRRTVRALRSKVEKKCQDLVKNVEIKSLFLKYSDICLSTI